MRFEGDCRLPTSALVEVAIEDEQEREDGEEAVVRDGGRQVAALVVGVLLQHRERKTEPRVPLLEAVEAAVSLTESAHSAPLGSRRPASCPQRCPASKSPLHRSSANRSAPRCAAGARPGESAQDAGRLLGRCTY